ncbi:MAG TPA: sugar transferase [Candidatus Acidoferrum sp.]|nr:sugar transferase [Candidatus Acidoferrum sp.]
MGNSYSRIPALWEQGLLRFTVRKTSSTSGSFLANREQILLEDSFHNILTLERRRAERSRRPFVLMLVDASSVVEDKGADRIMSRVISVLLKSTRETDMVGWYENGSVLGVIFTEINLQCENPITDILRSKIANALQLELTWEVASNLAISVHLFPQAPGQEVDEPAANTRFYPDLSKGQSKKRLPLAVKRVIDAAGSAALLIILSPLLAVIAVAIKLTSKGPIVFQQERLGQFGSRFKCLKFRTMHTNNDPKVHQEYIRGFIAGRPDSKDDKLGKPAVYKIKNDPRVTPLGRLLRKTSLDELPQFWNVLRGEMSLVGPRPSLPYEFAIYDIWHRRRVLEVKPGVTGLWQVSGRSRTCFDDMVRLDLRYSQSWSLWLDLRILIATPGAVISGEGAY